MPNRLARAASPYLRMHADNPVDWQPWDAAALAQARESDTPILLSIGYSACHWCHVMAHECFENAEIAALMNRWFVNIKLDREERPDIDRVYQLAHQALTGRGGGWPLTAFLDPQDLAPFYIGTYFSPTPRHGLPGLPQLLSGARAHFDGHRQELGQHSEALRDWLRNADAGTGGGAIDSPRADAEAQRRIGARFDRQWGGTAGAPKFPRATELEWLLDRRRESAPAAEMAQRTLAMMAARGLQDHLGGGFFRYCVDASWSIPHFEKMLYDNAQLLPVYARVAADAKFDGATRELAQAATHGIVAWLTRDMTAPSGAFYCALDADSEGEEGKFYLWSRQATHAALDDADFQLAESIYGLDKVPNFEARVWHLQRATPVALLAARTGIAPARLTTRIAAIRARLLEARAQRPPPARDDKMLCAWNALTISGLARGALLLDDAHAAELATRALAALRDTLWRDGKLYANVAEPGARIPGFLDDHAFLLAALLDCLQWRFARPELDWAIALADTLIADFVDTESGGLWFSTAQHATPLARSRNLADDSLPNGAGVAILALLRWGHLLGENRYLDAARRALAAASGMLQQHPDAGPTLLRAAREAASPRPQLVVRCHSQHADAWRGAARAALRDHGLLWGGDAVDVLLIPADAGDLPGVLAARPGTGESGVAYLCVGTHCLAPVESPQGLAAAMREAIHTPAAVKE